MPVPKVKELIEQKKIEATKELLSERELAVDDDFTKLSNEAQEGNKDVLAILTALIMLAPVLSIAITLVSLDIDSEVLRIMYSMLAGQFFTNVIVVYVMQKQFYTAIRRNTKLVYLHFDNKESVKRIKELELRLNASKSVNSTNTNNEKA